VFVVEVVTVDDDIYAHDRRPQTCRFCGLSTTLT